MAQAAQEAYTTEMLPPGLVFEPNGRCLFQQYLIPMAHHGRLPDDGYVQGSIAEGVDVYAVRPEALPFPGRSRGVSESDAVIWGYFFAKRPAAPALGPGEGGGGDGCNDDARKVAAGGWWRRCGGEKAYVGEDGEVYAFRAWFAFHDPGADGVGELTPWRMKEYRLHEAAKAFRNVMFHPSAKDLVILKVYQKAEIPEDEPDIEYYTTDDDDDDNNGEKEASVGEGPAANAA